MQTLTVGKLARQTGVAVETLRYYERRGLLPEAERTASGYRLFRADAVRRLRFIRRAQALGFSLDEIAELLSLSDDPGKSAAEVKRLTQSKIADIDVRIRDLQRMKRGLSKLDRRCSGHGSTEECPILAALADNAA
ncbi:MAG: heavy metal-responsive transcriptional regulator [Thiohalobacteraceae bacterium]|nr:heavy metal-responsive transcriptional regulator [Gammaproteobacteria bacterium]